MRSSNVRGLAEALAAEGEPRVAVWLHSSCLTSPRVTDVVDQAELRAIVDELGRGGGMGER